MIAYDIKLDANDDIFIDPIKMDFVISPSDSQHIKDILQSVPGWYKEFPLVGFNPYQYLNARINPQAVNQAAKIQLQADGYTIGSGGVDLTLTPDGILKVNTLDVTR